MLPPWILPHLLLCASITMPVALAPLPSSLLRQLLQVGCFQLLLLIHLSWVYLKIVLMLVCLGILRLFVAPIPLYLPMVLSWTARLTFIVARTTQLVVRRLRNPPLAAA